MTIRNYDGRRTMHEVEIDAYVRNQTTHNSRTTCNSCINKETVNQPLDERTYDR